MKYIFLNKNGKVKYSKSISDVASAKYVLVPMQRFKNEIYQVIEVKNHSHLFEFDRVELTMSVIVIYSDIAGRFNIYDCDKEITLNITNIYEFVNYMMSLYIMNEANIYSRDSDIAQIRYAFRKFIISGYKDNKEIFNNYDMINEQCSFCEIADVLYEIQSLYNPGFGSKKVRNLIIKDNRWSLDNKLTGITGIYLPALKSVNFIDLETYKIISNIRGIDIITTMMIEDIPTIDLMSLSFIDKYRYNLNNEIDFNLISYNTLYLATINEIIEYASINDIVDDSRKKMLPLIPYFDFVLYPLIKSIYQIEYYSGYLEKIEITSPNSLSLDMIFNHILHKSKTF